MISLESQESLGAPRGEGAETRSLLRNEDQYRKSKKSLGVDATTRSSSGYGEPVEHRHLQAARLINGAGGRLRGWLGSGGNFDTLSSGGIWAAPVGGPYGAAMGEEQGRARAITRAGPAHFRAATRALPGPGLASYPCPCGTASQARTDGDSGSAGAGCPQSRVAFTRPSGGRRLTDPVRRSVGSAASGSAHAQENSAADERQASYEG